MRVKLPRAVSSFKPGIYQHYKGAHYLALGIARDDETEEALVVYTRLYARTGVPMSVRRLAVWNEKVEVRKGKSVTKQPRFRYVGNWQP